MTPQPIQNSQPSPVTDTGVDAPAYELKFLVDARTSEQVQTWAMQSLQLSPDPHGDEAGAYTTTSLYFDTPMLDVYHRTPRYRRRKFRIRRYANLPSVFLERKTKSNDCVAKRRSSVGEEELASLALPMSLETWAGHWFHRRIMLKELRPACRIGYRRTALVGSCAEGPLRMTLDRDLRGVLSSDWRLPPLEGGAPLLADQVILELKFLRALPLPFKRLVEEFKLAPAPVSKYRLCRDVCGASSSSAKGVESTSEAARA